MANSRWGGLDQFRWVAFSPYSGNMDAFGRLRVGTPTTLFDSKLTIDNHPLDWDDQQTDGTASSAYSAVDASVTLFVTDGATGTRIRQTFRKFNYQPGKSQLVIMTGNIGDEAANVTKRWGLFDANNGVFFEQTSAGLFVVERRGGSDTRTAEADWTGRLPSDFDIATSQIWWMDIEWLGVGSVRYGIWHQGAPVVLHVAHHNNLITGTYMATPNLPLRWELSSSVAANATLKAICCTVISEGGSQETGREFSIDRGVTGLTTLDNNSLYPIVALRLKSTHLNADANIKNLQMFCNSTADFRWAILVDPTVTGTALSYASVHSNSAIEAAVTATNATTVSGGAQIASGYGADSVQVSVPVEASSPEGFRLGASIAGTATQVVLAAQRITGTTETFFGMLRWKENW